MKHFMRAMQTGNLVITWFASSMVDGKITVTEMATLIEKLAAIWKIRVALDLTGMGDQNLVKDLVAEDPAEFDAAVHDFSE